MTRGTELDISCVKRRHDIRHRVKSSFFLIVTFTVNHTGEPPTSSSLVGLRLWSPPYPPSNPAASTVSAPKLNAEMFGRRHEGSSEVYLKQAGMGRKISLEAAQEQ